MKFSKEFKILMGIYAGMGILTGVTVSKVREIKKQIDEHEIIIGEESE